jgi:hypothetical protein
MSIELSVAQKWPQSKDGRNRILHYACVLLAALLIKLSMETEDRRRMNLPGSAHTEINHGNRGCSVVCGDFEKQTVGFGRNDFYLPSGYG